MDIGLTTNKVDDMFKYQIKVLMEDSLDPLGW